MSKVAVIGGGPAGIVAARYLKSEGFEPVLYEQGERLGGQWTGDPRYSGVWPAMRTNTSRVMTAFSDRRHDRETPVFPTNQMVCAYLQAYAEQFELLRHARLRTAVRGLSRNQRGDAWAILSEDAEGRSREDTYEKVVVATGRYHHPAIPPVPGLESYSGRRGLVHAFGYKHPEVYRGLRVLVAGCSISALEIASDLAMLGASRVVSTNRRQRYVLHKQLAGVPTDHLAFTRFAALAEECMPMEAVAAGLKDFVTKTSGSPEQFGAPRPAGNILEAGITQSQHFMPLVAEGRIAVKPWIAGVDGEKVRFTDGTEEEFDAIIFGTGYHLDLPFLSEELRRTLDIDAKHIDLYKHTFHPALPGLAFLGLLELIGPYYPVLELQARWIAYAWSGTRPAPGAEAMGNGLAAYRARRGGPQEMPMHAVAIQFAREAGVEPVLADWPELTRALLFGPLSPMSFRLHGPDALLDAAQRVAEDAAAFGAVPEATLPPDQRAQLQTLAAAHGDPGLARATEACSAAIPQPALSAR